MDSDKRKLTKNIFSLGIVQIANYVLPLISVPIISRIIGPEKYGVINFSLSFIAYFTLLIGYGFDFTATRKIAQSPNDANFRNKVFSEIFYAQIFLFLISVIGFIICLSTVKKLEEEEKVAIFTFLACIATVLTQNWFFQAMQDLQKVAIINFSGKLIFVCSILLVVHKRSDYVWQPLVASVVSIACAVTSFLWAMKRYHVRLVKVQLSKCFQLLYDERIIFFSMVVVNIYTTTNTVILGLYESNTQVGYYTAGQRLIIIAQSVITIPLSQSLYPFIGKAFAQGRATGIRVVQQIVPLILILTGVITLVLLIAAPIMIHLFYGKAFAPSTGVFRILVAIPMLIALSNVLGIQIMLNLKMDKIFFRITALGALLSICLNFILIHKLGYIGSALNWVITELFILIAMFIVLRRQDIQPVNFHFWRWSTLNEYLIKMMESPLGKKFVKRART